MSGNTENNAAANGANGNGTEKPPPVSPTDWRVIVLGIYLILTLLLGIYLLSIMIMAEDADKAVGDLRTSCCGNDNRNCAPLPTQTANVSNANVANQTAANLVNSNATNTANANQTAIANAAANKPANTAANSANANSGAKTTPTPTPIPSSTPNTIPEISIPPYLCVSHFNRISADGFLFLLVIFAGMLGAAVRGIFSFVRHIGIKDFSFSWTWFYILLPFSGAPVSLFLYFIIRGGFYGSPVGKGLILNLASFAALGCLSGLFSENAMEKLREVAEVILAKVPAKTDSPPKTNKPDNGGNAGG